MTKASKSTLFRSDSLGSKTIEGYCSP